MKFKNLFYVILFSLLFLSFANNPAGAIELDRSKIGVKTGDSFHFDREIKVYDRESDKIVTNNMEEKWVVAGLEENSRGTINYTANHDLWESEREGSYNIVLSQYGYQVIHTDWVYWKEMMLNISANEDKLPSNINYKNHIVDIIDTDLEFGSITQGISITESGAEQIKITTDRRYHKETGVLWYSLVVEDWEYVNDENDLVKVYSKIKTVQRDRGDILKENSSEGFLKISVQQYLVLPIGLIVPFAWYKKNKRSNI